MANVFLNSAKTRFANGSLDWDTDDIRVRLCMTNTTCDTENDGVSTISNYTTVDPCDATGYADQALTGESVTTDDTNDRTVLDANDSSFTGLSGDATRAIQGALFYKYVDGTNANDIPIGFADFTSDIPATATQIDLPYPAGGIFQNS